MRTPLAFAASAAIVLGLVGLTGCANSAAACDLVATPGAATKAITVTGDFGKKPTVTFTPGVTVGNTEAAVVTSGSGNVVRPGEAVSLDAQIYDAKTGKLLQGTPYDGASRATIPVDVKTFGGIAKAVQCQKVGSRIVSVIGNDETLATTLGLTKNDTVVAVFDIVSSSVTKADGAPQVVPDGLPQVVLSESGAPGITIPKTAAPTELKIAVLKKGSGEVVPAHANVTVQYTGVVWQQDAQPFDSSWDRGAPADFPVDDVVPGFRDAIVGQTVGSQVLVVIPPALGYKDKAQGAIPANSTLVFVIDILGVKK